MAKESHSIFGAAFFPIWVVLCLTCVICACSRNVDPRLKTAESIMEEHPDSALMILDEYKFASNSTLGDSALYGLLLTHARYKNFIDETNDSLISASASYFMEHNDPERASKSLFLKGMIQMRTQKFGAATLSFINGLDAARE